MHEHRAIDIARAMQDAHDLNALRDEAVEDEVRKLGESARLGRYVRPHGTGFGEASQYLHACFEPGIQAGCRPRVDLADLQPNVDQIAACLGGIADLGHRTTF